MADSDINAADPRLRREFQRLGVNLRFRYGEAPGRKRVGWELAEGGKSAVRGHRDVEVAAGPDGGSKQSTGLARAALEALAHCPRPEGSFPEEMIALFGEEPLKFFLSFPSLECLYGVFPNYFPLIALMVEKDMPGKASCAVLEK